MAIREILNENPQVAIKGVVVILIFTLIAGIWHVLPAHHGAVGTREFFSDDDGDTWFPSDGSMVAPFDHDGREAVLAKVFKCRNGTKFVGYLEKFTDDARKRINTARANGTLRGGTASLEAAAFDGVLVKKPHDAKWVRNNDPAAIAVKTFACPNGFHDYLPLTP